MTFNVALFCASRPSNNPSFVKSSYSLGCAIARRDWGIVYGGGDSGLMGALAVGALAENGTVIGVIPTFLLGKEGDRKDLTEKYVTETLQERMDIIKQRADAYVIMPGGVGTLDELMQIWGSRLLDFHHAPILFYNMGGYFDELLAFLKTMVSHELSGAHYMDVLEVHEDENTLLASLAETQKNPSSENMLGKTILK